jgi:hypothetical protein
MLKAVLLKVFELAGSETDHIPPVMVRVFAIIFKSELQGQTSFYRSCQQYDFEISNAKRADDRDEVYSRVSNLPALINLGS